MYNENNMKIERFCGRDREIEEISCLKTERWTRASGNAKEKR